MKTAVFSDIHANEEAFLACMKRGHELGCERFWSLGDAVGYLPPSQLVLAKLQEEFSLCLLGNHEDMVLCPSLADPLKALVYGMERTLGELTDEHLRVFATWPRQDDVALAAGRILLVHGSPDDPTWGYVYPDTPLDAYANSRRQYVFMGHTHRPFIRKHGETIFINCGSVGLPRDRAGVASFAIIDATTGQTTIEKVPFDPQATLRRATGIHPTVQARLLAVR